MNDKWTPEMEAEFRRDWEGLHPYILGHELDRVNPSSGERTLWLAGRNRGAREERERVLKLWDEHHWMDSCGGHDELRRRLEGLSHD